MRKKEKSLKLNGENIKIGDCVNLTFYNGDVCIVTVQGIKDNNLYFDNECTSLIAELEGNLGDWVVTSKWYPKENDWVLCWNAESPHLVSLRQVKKYPSEVRGYRLRDTIDNYWNHFFPVKTHHQLPLHLRDNR